MTLVEVAVAMPIILVAMSMFSSTLVAMFEQRSVNRENTRAYEAIQNIFEQMRNEDLEDVVALYNDDDFDDPNGPGTAPGSRFAIPEIELLPGTPEGLAGEILLPLVDTADPGFPSAWELREDMEDVGLGMPRDLNRDHQIDAEDHSADYVVLPIAARVRWQGKFGPRELTMYTVFTGFRITTQ